MFVRKCIMVSLLVLFLADSLTAQGIKYEAENGVLAGSLAIQTSQPGYSGSGYVGRFENDGDRVTINFSLAQEGNYRIFIGYAAPYGEKINIININGNTADVSFPASSIFREIYFGKARLREGGNSISILKSWGWFLLDYILIELSTGPDTEVAIPYPLATDEPLEETNRLFFYLMDQFTRSVHSGTMSLNAIEEAEWIFSQTGKYPALIGLDFMNHTREWAWYDKNVLVTEARKWYGKNGLVAVCWHWRDPSRMTDEFYTSGTSFDVSRISDTGSPEYSAMLSDIDVVAGYLKQLQDSSVPVLFRPLHEASGRWFWWGAKGPDPCKTLWILMFDRLVNHHGLKNLLWVWTTDTRTDNLSWYPGDPYVDILGVDIYAGNGDFGSQVLTFNKVKEDFRGRKLIALSENGVIPHPDNLIADKAAWSWFMTWYGKFVRDPGINPADHWQTVMNHSFVISLDEMPDLRNYPVGIPQQLSSPDEFRVHYSTVDRVIHVNTDDGSMPYDLYLYDHTGRLHYGISGNTGSIVIPLRGGVNTLYLVRIVSQNRCRTFKILTWQAGN